MFKKGWLRCINPDLVAFFCEGSLQLFKRDALLKRHGYDGLARLL